MRNLTHKELATIAIWTVVTLIALVGVTLMLDWDSIPLQLRTALIPTVTLLMGLIGGSGISPNRTWRYLEVLVLPLAPIVVLSMLCFAIIFTFLILGADHDRAEQLAAVQLILAPVGCFVFYPVLLGGFIIGNRLRKGLTQPKDRIP